MTVLELIEILKHYAPGERVWVECEGTGGYFTGVASGVRSQEGRNGTGPIISTEETW
jgi:hypothetical protein